MTELLTPPKAAEITGRSASFLRKYYKHFGGLLIGKRKYFTMEGLKKPPEKSTEK